MKKILLLSICCFLATATLAQKQANRWYFGGRAGLDFNSGSPVAFGNSAMNMLEGCASPADSAGNTLFYTDGASVWNKNDIKMPNGTGLLGDNNSAQAAIAFRAPGSYSKYYIFTTPTSGNKPMNYSVVDMNLAGGLGDVTTKNAVLFNLSTEKVTAVYHSNGTDIWAIGHQYGSNTFYAYLVTAAGVSSSPVVTSIGTNHTGYLGFAGYMKASHNGKKLALACTVPMSMVEVFDFDNTTGIISNPITFNNITEAYGLEFSPDDTKLYATEENPKLVIQWDLSAGSASAIAASQMVVGNVSSPPGALQLGPDGVIYVAKRSSASSLGGIMNPNTAGTGSNYVDVAVSLAGGTNCQYGLPNFFQSLVASSTTSPSSSFGGDTAICQGMCVDFKNKSTNATSYKWNFPGGTPATSTLDTPTVCYANPGYYNVRLIASDGSKSDTELLVNYVHVQPAPNAGTLSADRDSICIGTAQTSNLVTTGSSGSLQWILSTGTGYTSISGATGAAYTTLPGMSQTTNFKTVATNGVCPADTSAALTITILPSPTADYNVVYDSLEATFTSTVTGNVTYYNWDFGDGQTSNDINPVHTYDSTGVYQVCLTVYNASNCSYTICKPVEVTGISNVGIGSLSVSSRMIVYPNPAGEQLTVNSTGLQGSYQLMVYNVLGQEMMTQLTDESGITTLSVAHLAAGTYTLVMKGSEGVYVQKFVKK